LRRHSGLKPKVHGEEHGGRRRMRQQSMALPLTVGGLATARG
jgi:hypothetical protein